MLADSICIMYNKATVGSIVGSAKVRTNITQIQKSEGWQNQSNKKALHGAFKYTQLIEYYKHKIKFII